MMRLVLLAALLAAYPAAHACGYCVEDGIAATYDHAVIQHALGARHQVAFFALEGRLAGGDALRGAIQRALASTVGIDRGSIRVSIENAALSFAFDPRRRPLGVVLREVHRKLADVGLSLMLIRVMT